MPDYFSDISDDRLIDESIDELTAPLEEVTPESPGEDESRRPHPAKFSPAIMEAIVNVCADYLDTDRANKILDPFAGVGSIHALRMFGKPDVPMLFETWGVEIEPEWADQSPFTICGDSRNLHALESLGPWDAIITSPAYANRMADSYDGRDGSRRHTYRIDLGRELSESNAAGMGWTGSGGDDYRALHSEVWAQAHRILRPGGFFVVNIKNHIRKVSGRSTEQLVAEWHAQSLLNLGMYLREVRRVDTPGMRHGENGQARVDGELLMIFQKAE